MKCKCHNQDVIELAIDYPVCQVTGEALDDE